MQDEYEAATRAAQQFYDAEAAWMRHVLLIASSALTLLVILNQEVPERVWPRYFLAAAWILLGTGIVAGAVASHATVRLLRSLAFLQELALMEELHLDRSSLPKPVLETRGYRVSRTIMVIALVGAVICLTGYGLTSLLDGARIPTAPD